MYSSRNLKCFINPLYFLLYYIISILVFSNTQRTTLFLHIWLLMSTHCHVIVQSLTLQAQGRLAYFHRIFGRPPFACHNQSQSDLLKSHPVDLLFLFGQKKRKELILS